MIGIRKASVVVVAVCMAMTLAACPKKPKPEDLGGSQFGRKPGDQSSLEKFKQGLQPGEGGPLSDVRFDYDRYDLRDDARSTLQQNADWLKSNAGTRVEVEGHCDERGTVEYNLALGAKRAKAARDYLVSLGVSGDRISTISYGEELPLCREQTEDCYARNRRDHFVVLQ